MISFDEAIAILGAAARPMAVETLSLQHASGRVLAAPVIAQIDSPRADVSAMDGYAVRNADLGHVPVSLDLVGQSFPGAPWPHAVQPGTCVRIFTGAPVPAGADRIIIQEQVRREDGKAFIEKAPADRSWIRPQAADFGTGEELASSGQLLDPASLVAIAGSDVAEVMAFMRPRVALLVTGDELVEPGSARCSPFAVPDSVSFGVTALARQWGADVVHFARVRDDPTAMDSAASTALDVADLIVVTGGASVGERDLAKSMFRVPGLDLDFSTVAIRPGMPAWFGHAAGRPVLGLPGNPTSALVTARLFLAPLLASMQGRSVADALSFEPASLSTPVPACDARETFHRARLLKHGAALLAFQESHAQKPLADADVLVRQPAHSPALATGTIVQVLRL